MQLLLTKLYSSALVLQMLAVVGCSVPGEEDRQRNLPLPAAGGSVARGGLPLGDGGSNVGPVGGGVNASGGSSTAPTPTGGSAPSNAAGTASGGDTGARGTTPSKAGGPVSSGGATPVAVGGSHPSGGSLPAARGGAGGTSVPVFTGGTAPLSGTGGFAPNGGQTSGGQPSGENGGSLPGGSASLTGGTLTQGGASSGGSGGGSAGTGQGLLLEAEDYVAYSDSTGNNQGNAYRQDGVDIESCSEGGFNVAWITSGEWLEFEFTVGSADLFDIAVRLASPLAKTQGFQLVLDGVDLAGWLAVPSTVSWQTWQSVVLPAVTIAPGTHRLRIVLGGDFNLNYLFLASATNPPPQPSLPGSGPPPLRPASYVGAVERHGQLGVSGRALVDSRGNPVQLRGIGSHGLQWNPFIKGHTIANLAYTWGVDVIRPAMYVEDVKNGALWAGYVSQPEYMKQKLVEMIEDSIEVGAYVFVDWHIHNDPGNFLALATEFFRDMATRYGGKAHIIYEICNEPEYVSWDVIRDYAQQLIPVIRSVDPDNLILVGAPNWCQDLDTVANAPLEGFTNVMYSLHFYAGTHGQALRDKADYALARNLPIFVSEWGMSDSTGGSNQQVFAAESQTWLDWVNQRGLSWVNWSFSNKAEASAALLPGVSLAGPWPNSDLAVSGKFVKAAIANR